jgi:hypothetical protein
MFFSLSSFSNSKTVMEWFNAVRETQAQMEKFIWEENDMLASIL